MKKMKILLVGLMLTLTGAVFALTHTNSSSDTCSMSKNGNCCNPEKACCKDGTCPMCKGKKAEHK